MNLRKVQCESMMGGIFVIMQVIIMIRVHLLSDYLILYIIITVNNN